MIDFKRMVLDNGLRVLIHEDNSTPLAAVSLIYDVGSRDENPEKTGFAHLFEHLMFGGSKNAKDYDQPIQKAGGESNAFTNTDITNFYATVPADNIETVLWLESDRMLDLTISKKTLNVQRKVVIEEFKETTLNEPYGDIWHHLSALTYKVHPYRWPVIGQTFEHIENATLSDVKYFYKTYYTPDNAVLTIAGNFQKAGGTEGVARLAEKWFGNVPAGHTPKRRLAKEPLQTEARRTVREAQVPLDALYIAFHAPARLDIDYYAVDLLTDVLSSGSSSRLYRRLLKEQRLFSEIDCYQTGSLDPGLVIIEAKPTEGVSHEAAEAAIWSELNQLKTEQVPEHELQKLKNKVESQQTFSDAGALNKAMNLGYYEIIGKPALINEEFSFYQAVQPADIQRLAQSIFKIDNSSTLWYWARK